MFGHTNSWSNTNTNEYIINLGNNRIRIALVAEISDCIEAAKRIKKFIENIY